MDLVHINMWNQSLRKQDKVEDNILNTLRLVVTVQGKGIVAKADRIKNGMRNHNVPVDMSDNFYDNGWEGCKYLITDPRSDAYLNKNKNYTSRHESTPDYEKSAEEVVKKYERILSNKTV